MGLPQYFKMMVLLLYIQNQDKKNDQKKSNSPKKNSESCYYPKQPPKSLKRKFATHHNFFLQVMNEILERKKITKNKTSKRKRNNVFVFDPEVPKKRLQLSCKSKKTQKASKTRKTKILQKNPMKYTHKKVELKKKKSSEKKLLLPFSFLLYNNL